MEGFSLSSQLDDVVDEDLSGFFVGWPNPPSSAARLTQLQNSSIAIIARENASRKIVGFVTVLTDQVLFAYVSALEVLPEFQGRGIGKALVEAALERTKDVYAIDLVCDPEVQPFYEKCGLIPYHSMIARRREAIR